MNLKLKTFWIGLIAALSVLASGPAHAYSSTFTTARDWQEKMTPTEKFMSIAAPMSVLHRYGVPFRHAPQAYIPALDVVIRNNPHLLGEDVANVFASTVYLLEPESRRPLDELESRFLKGEFESVPVRILVPSLD